MQTCDRERVLEIFKRSDLNADGRLEKHELMLILQKLDPVGMTDTFLKQMMVEADINMDGAIDFEEFLNWVWYGSGVHQETLMGQVTETVSATAKSQPYEVSVLTIEGDEVARLMMSPTDMIGDLKVKIREGGGPPKELQQLIFEGAILTDDAVVCDLCGAAMSVHLVRLPRPPLLLDEFSKLVRANYTSREQLVRALEEAFDGRIVDGQVREGRCMEDDESNEGEREEEEVFLPEDNVEEYKQYGVALGTPLFCLAGQVSTSGQLASIASWLIAAGGSIYARPPAYDEDHSTRSVIEEYFRLHKASLIQAVLDAGLEIPLSLSLIWSALPRDCHFKPDVCPPVSRSEWSFSRKMEDLKQVVGDTKELVDFISILRLKFLPALDLPADMLARPLPRQGGGQQCFERSLFLEAIEDGCIWALAELLRHGVHLPEPPDLEEGMIRPDRPIRDEILDCADKLEASCPHVQAFLCLAIWQNDAAEVRKLLKEGILDGWGGYAHDQCVSLILLATSAGASPEIVDAILDDPRVDPNLGLWEYGWSGSFQLWSALGKMTDNFVADSVDVDSFDYVVSRLASDPRSDLSFGKLQRGERSEGAQRKGCGIGSLLQTLSDDCGRSYLTMLALLRAGAPLPMGMAEPRIAENGGEWGYNIWARRSHEKSSDEPFQQSWLRHVVEHLESLLGNFIDDDGAIIMDGDVCDPVKLRGELALARAAVEAGSEEESGNSEKMRNATERLLFCKNKAAADVLLPLLKRVIAGFRVEELSAFPIPDKLVARALRRWRGRSAVLESGTEAEQLLPERALQEVLSFLPLWASSWSRADHTRDLTLGFCGPGSGMPMRSADIKLQACTVMLSEWWWGKYPEESDDYN